MLILVKGLIRTSDRELEADEEVQDYGSLTSGNFNKPYTIGVNEAMNRVDAGYPGDSPQSGRDVGVTVKATYGKYYVCQSWCSFYAIPGSFLSKILVEQRISRSFLVRACSAVSGRG